MKYKLLLPLVLLFASVPLSARADVNSCTLKLIKERKVFSPWAFTGGDYVAKTEHNGATYHLIYLMDEAGRETTVVVKENSSVCEAAYYNPTGGGPDAEKVLPGNVFKALMPAATARNKERLEREQARDRQLAEEYKRLRGD
ncbi:hypothetical protein ACSYAD_18495 [Acaryochloris marina NIES-2412]|uniref:hypothetical protein n=1 Tax=Acaryochloris marina TaxID=155978 RepID=UPI00405A0C4B